MNKLKLDQMVQTKYEYILSKDFKMLTQIKNKINKDTKPFEQKYEKLFETLKKNMPKITICWFLHSGFMIRMVL